MKTVLLSLAIACILLFSGCTQSYIKAQIPGDGMAEMKGKAADDYTKAIVQNIQTSEGRVNETFDSLKKLAPFLFITLLSGGVFAFWTRSKYAAIIPVTAAIGLGLIFFIGAWVDYIKWIMLGLVVAIIIWRAIVYQRERNNNSMDLKVVSDNATRIIDDAKTETKKAMDTLKNNINSP